MSAVVLAVGRGVTGLPPPLQVAGVVARPELPPPPYWLEVAAHDANGRVDSRWFLAELASPPVGYRIRAGHPPFVRSWRTALLSLWRHLDRGDKLKAEGGAFFNQGGGDG
jgi:hypothetical protein